MKPTVALIIPIYNAAKDIPFLLPAIMQQSLQPDHILIIDSSSTDHSAHLLSAYPVTIQRIPQSEFDHGGTRKLGAKLIEADIYLYLTQDAYPADKEAFKNLIEQLMSEEKIACAYGRQLPKPEATPLSEHLRLFNYPEQTQIKYYPDKNKYGIKTCFNSDSFAAYKKKPLEEIGHFPENIMTSEDTYVAAKLLKQGYAIAYAANAKVYHSHHYTLSQEFHRYFSIGVFHARDNWIIDEYNSATGEGLRFIQSEWRFLCQQKKYHLIPRAWISTVVKYIGYQLGLHEKYLPFILKKRMGINRAFWFKTQNR